MPELPDVEIFKKEAEKALNAKVNSIEIYDKQFVNTSESSITKNIKGKILEKATRQGKNLFLNMGDKSGISMHFGMTGYLQYIAQKDEKPKYAKLSLKLDNEHSLFYMSKRKLGKIIIADDIDKHIKSLQLGPDALEIKEEDFINNLKESNAAIKSFITDQSVVSGIGNVYADEILFQARVHPKKKSGQLTQAQAKNIYSQIGKVLKTAIENQADVSRLPKTFLIHSRKEGEKCPGCKGQVQKIKISGRTGYFCPDCQKKSE